MSFSFMIFQLSYWPLLEDYGYSTHITSYKASDLEKPMNYVFSRESTELSLDCTISACLTPAFLWVLFDAAYLFYLKIILQLYFIFSILYI